MSALPSDPRFSHVSLRRLLPPTLLARHPLRGWRPARPACRRRAPARRHAPPGRAGGNGSCLAALRVVALHFMLRVHEVLLDGADGAQVTPHGQHGPTVAQPHCGPGHGDAAAFRRAVIEFAPPRHAVALRFLQQQFYLLPRRRIDRLGPGPADPALAARMQWRRASATLRMTPSGPITSAMSPATRTTVEATSGARSDRRALSSVAELGFIPRR